MKKFAILLLATTFLSLVADVIILKDEFQWPLRRCWWITQTPTREAVWEKEYTEYIFGSRIKIRYFNPSVLTKVEVIDANGKVIFSNTDFSRYSWANIPVPGTYTIKVYGKATDKNTSVAIDIWNKKTPGSKEWDTYFMTDWRFSDNAAKADPAGGALLIPVNKKYNSIYTVTRSLTPGKMHRISFAVQSAESQQITLVCSYKKNGKRAQASKNFFVTPGKINYFTFDYLNHDPKTTYSVYFQKPITFKQFTLTQLDSVPQAQKNRKIGNTVALYEARAPFADPVDDQIQTPVIYRRAPRKNYFDSVPQKFELINSVDTFANPGDFAVWYFSVYNPVGDKSIGQIDISDLTDGKNIIPAKKIKLNFVEFHDFPISNCNYMNIPEKILPVNGAPEGKLNRIFWLQSKLDKDIAPGIYSGSVSVMCGIQKLTLPIRLRVMPFKLSQPENMFWSVYSNLFHNQKRHYSDEVAERYLRDLYDYGITSIHANVGGGTEDVVKRIQRLRMKIGMNGPMFFAGALAEYHAYKKLGLKGVNSHRQFVDKDGKTKWWYESENVREEFKKHLKYIDFLMKHHGSPEYHNWYYLGHDEAHLYADLFRSAMHQFRLAKEAGVKTIATIYPAERMDEIGKYVDICNNMIIGNNRMIHEQLMSVGKKRGFTNIYLGAGCYVGQEGGLMPNRLLAGFLSYKLGVSGHLSYTYQEPAYPVDHFKRGKVYCLVYPTAKRPSPDKVNIFTLEYEGIREGIIDYKYMNELSKAIAAARKAGRIAEADEAEKTMKKILDLIPYYDEFKEAGNGNSIMQKNVFDNNTADYLRMLAADAILKLTEGNK